MFALNSKQDRNEYFGILKNQIPLVSFGAEPILLKTKIKTLEEKCQSIMRYQHKSL